MTGVPKELVGRILRNRVKGESIKQKYPEEIMKFAMTLQFYSMKAYKYVRNTLNIALPHPAHLRSIYSRVNGEPGFTEGAFSALKSKAQSNLEKEKITPVSVMMDDSLSDIPAMTGNVVHPMNK